MQSYHGLYMDTPVEQNTRRIWIYGIHTLFQLKNGVTVYTMICKRANGFLCSSPLEKCSTGYLSHTLRIAITVSDFDFLSLLIGKETVIPEEGQQLFPVSWDGHDLFPKTEKQLSPLYLGKLLIHPRIPATQLDLIRVASYFGHFSLDKWRLLDHLTCCILVCWHFLVYFNDSTKLSCVAA